MVIVLFPRRWFLSCTAAAATRRQFFFVLQLTQFFFSPLFYDTGIPQGIGAAALGHWKNARRERRSHPRHQQTLKVVCVTV